MIYEEFVKNDTIGAYSDFKSVKELKRLGRIPQEYHQYIDDVCECGSDRIMNVLGTIITCCDHRCYVKMGYNLDKFLKFFDCKGIGPATCISICKKGVRDGIFILPSFIEILNCFDRFQGLLGAKYSDLLDVIDRINNEYLSFYQMIQCLGIYGLDSSCSKIFKGIKDFDHLMEILKTCTLQEFFAERGVFDKKRVIEFYLHLVDIKAFSLVYKGSVKLPALREVKVCITGAVRPNGASLSRKDFIGLCNRSSVVNGTPIFNFTEGKAFSSASYFIYDRSTGSETERAALKRQAMTDEKIIYTSKEFLDLIRGEVLKCQQKVMEMKETST